MRLTLLVGMVFVACCSGQRTVHEGSRLFNNHRYLEYLNDLDRRNVELEYDMHKQWPFLVPKTPEPKNLEKSGDANFDNRINSKNLEYLKDVADLAREQWINRDRQYQEYNPHTSDDSYNKHMRHMADLPSQLSQYIRYNVPTQEKLEEARMYPVEEDFTFNDDDDEPEDKYQLSENNFLPEEEQTYQGSLGHPIFSNILHKSKNAREIMQDYEEAEEEVPKHSSHHDHEDYKFKEGEEFPQTISFDDIPLADDPSEFGVGPSDIRFFKDPLRTEEEITITPRSKIASKQADVKLHLTKPKIVASRSDSNQPNENSLLNQGSSEKDVEVVPFKPDSPQVDTAGVYIIAVIAGISAAATVGLIAVGIGWYNLQKHMKNAEDSDYPSYGIVGPNKDYEKKDRDDAGDRRLAQSAQMYHYQHQKQQIIAMGRNPQGGHGSQSDTEEEEDEEGNYTVYECPGLASIEGPLEVKNPMFDDDQLATPSQTPSKSTNQDDTK